MLDLISLEKILAVEKMDLLKIEKKQIEAKLEGSQEMPAFLAVQLSISQLGVLY